MIQLSLIDPEDARDAWHWHSGFCASNDLVFPRTIDDYGRLAQEGQIWAARDGSKYLSLCYFQLGRSEKYNGQAWEVGGLMVANSERSRGLGKTITCLTLGHVLTQYDPHASKVPVVAHVHAENNKPGPRPIFEGFLKFGYARPVAIPGNLLTGLRTNKDGFVEGHELEISYPSTPKALADWCEGWKGKLKDGTEATVNWGLEGSPKQWAKALRNIAAR